MPPRYENPQQYAFEQQGFLVVMTFGLPLEIGKVIDGMLCSVFGDAEQPIPLKIISPATAEEFAKQNDLMGVTDEIMPLSRYPPDAFYYKVIAE